MPGIVGIIAQGASAERTRTLDRMVQSMMHESFYRSGTEVNERLSTWAGWICHEGSFSDCMPVWNESRDVCLIFSGETYPDQTELQRLKQSGQCASNAQYLVHIYEQMGIKFLERLNGWFSGILLDLRENKVVVFNDRYGLGKLYYHENEEGLYFASEAKALLKVLPQLRRLDWQGVGEFFSCGAVLQQRTLFAGVSVMPPGAAWTFSLGQRARKETYFRKELWEDQPPLPEWEYYERLKETWGRLLPRYLTGPQGAALSLTGGVDSRMILAWTPTPGSLPCYTFGGKYRDCMDVKVAREVARICRQPYDVIPVSNEFLNDFGRLAERTVYISDGAMDVTGAIDLYVQQKARAIAPIRITGTNGGEILRRLIAFKPSPPAEDVLEKELAEQTRQAARTYAQELEGNKLSFTAFKQTPWHMCSKFAVERSQLTLRMPFFDNDLVALSYQAPPALAESNAPTLRLIAEGRPELGSIETDRGLTTRSSRILAGARNFFQEFTFKAEYAYDYGMPQWLARLDHVFAPLHLERLFLGRHKFHHFRVYYRDYLRNYVKAVLLDPKTRSRSYLRPSNVESIVNGHLGGGRNHTVALHKLLTIELIERHLLQMN